MASSTIVDAQNGWTKFPLPAYGVVRDFRAISENECAVLWGTPLYRDNPIGFEMLRADARTGKVTLLLRRSVGGTALMDWISRDRGVVILAAYRAKDTSCAWWTSDAGQHWDSTFFHLDITPAAVQLTFWGTLALHDNAGAIEIVPLPDGNRRSVRSGISPLRDVHFLDSLIVVARSDSGLWRSSDGGATWANTFNPPGTTYGWLKKIFHHCGDGALFFSNSSTIRRSLDSGRTWQPLPILPDRSSELLDATGASSYWMQVQGDRDLDSYEWPRSIVSVQSDGSTDVFSAPGWLAYSAPLSMWSESAGWCVCMSPPKKSLELYFTQTGGVRPRSISASDYSTANHPRLRILFGTARHGTWQDCNISRRKAGDQIWGPTRPLLFPNRVYWDDSVEVGTAYEYSIRVAYSDGSSDVQLTAATASDTSTFVDVAEYCVPARGCTLGYATEYAWKAMLRGVMRVRNGGSLDSAGYSVTYLDETRVIDHGPTTSARSRLLISHDEVPAIFVASSEGNYIAKIPRYIRLERGSRTTLPDTIHAMQYYESGIPYTGNGVQHTYSYGFKRHVGMLFSHYSGQTAQFGLINDNYDLKDTLTEDGKIASPAFHLGSVFPQPLRTEGTFSFSLERPESVVITLHSLLGQRVSLLHDGRLEAGERHIPLHRAGLPAGCYILRFQTASTSLSKLVLLQ